MTTFSGRYGDPMKRRTAWVLALATTSVLLMGFGVYITAKVLLRPPPAAMAADVVGDWSGRDNVVLTLDPDHTFDARNLPLNIQSSRYSTPFSGSGQWRLSAPDRYHSQDVVVEIDGYGMPLTLARVDNRVRLYLTDIVGGGGDRFWLDRS
ncbi:hypothetical protein ACQPWW_09270 [Micromonospora sp. CA-240977]|uniref:hypothetical protein n=1 Tax=Micromonospora sp. CA-240977 TaxID=3239957 RepID=UPI003D939BF1